MNILINNADKADIFAGLFQHIKLFTNDFFSGEKSKSKKPVSQYNKSENDPFFANYEYKNEDVKLINEVEQIIIKKMCIICALKLNFHLNWIKSFFKLFVYKQNKYIYDTS
jgi:hypothetical protein